jgi:hypothetical protein
MDSAPSSPPPRVYSHDSLITQLEADQLIDLFKTRLQLWHTETVVGHDGAARTVLLLSVLGTVPTLTVLKVLRTTTVPSLFLSIFLRFRRVVVAF